MKGFIESHLRREKLSFWLPLAVLILLTLWTYLPSLQNGFVNLDDPLLLTENRWVQSVSAKNIFHAFTSYDPELYIPLTFIGYMLEYAIFGLHATGYHAISLLLHIINIILVACILRKLSANNTATLLTAGLFALHPINAEAVLWLSAQKDLLSSSLMLGALLAYLHEEESSKQHYRSFTLFFLAVIAKVMVATLPCIFLVLAWYKHQSLRETLRKIWPFFLLSCIFIGIAVVGKTHILDETTISEKILMAPQSITLYLQKLIVPTDLSVVYHSVVRPSLSNTITLLGLLLCAMLGSSIFLLRKYRFVLAGSAFFLITLAPTFLNFAKGESLFIGSDRYIYLPEIGIFLMLAVLVQHIATRWTKTHLSRLSLLTIGVSMFLGLLIFWTPIIHARTEVFSNSIPFNADIIQKAPHEYRAYHNLGVALEDAGKIQEAIDQYTRAVTINPFFADSWINRAILEKKLGNVPQAENSLLSYLKFGKENPKALFLLASFYKENGKCKDAIPFYERAISALPEFPLAHRDIALCLGKEKRYKEAIEHFKILENIDPDFRANLEEGGLLNILQNIK